MHQIFDRFWHLLLVDFGSQLGAKLATFSDLFRAKTPQDAPRTATRRPKTPPRHPKTPQDAPRRPQDASEAPKTLPRRRFWKNFGEILEILGRFLEDFLGRFCCPTCLLKLTFEKEPASTNPISKKANLKNRGPAVIAAGVGNPPAPACGQGCQQRDLNSRTD